MEPTQKAAASPDAMTDSSGQASPEETVHPPQSVGREFVRQYYTMLHQAPEQLHRFYSQNSSFLHEHWDNSGIEEKPAIGQIEIYERIKTMNFRDCHAKIFQVDSQLSVCHTVVVQVLGELSNNGEPLRKFMQTFVLVPQTNKKYYVHNDIFRYQDDEVSFGQEAAPEPEYNNGVGEEELDSINLTHGVTDQLSEVLYVQQVEESVMSMAGPVQGQGEVPEETKVAVMEAKMENNFDESEHKTPITAAASEEVGVNPSEEKHKDREAGNKPVIVSSAEIRDSPLPPQKLSWAEMASRNVGSTFKPLPAKAEQRNGGPTPTVNNARSSPTPTARSPPPQQPQQQQLVQKPANHREQHYQPHHSLDEGQNNSTPGRGMQFYPDQQQIFVGNLPHHMSDQDLKEFFEKYGKVLDIRINRKPNNSLPNFGFIAFDSAETVKHILSLRPLYYNGKFRVNVEEKKRREDLIGSRPRSGNVTSGGHNNQSPDRGVSNGNFVPRDETPKAAGQGGTTC